MTASARTVRLLDLNAEQIERLELAMDAPVDQWGSAPKGRLFPLIIHEIEGGDLDELRRLPFRELVERVQLEDDEPKDESESG